VETPLTKVVEVMVDPGWNFCCDEEQSVRREHQYSALSLVTLELQKHGNFQQNLEKQLKTFYNL
jgi:hypothetical protein